MTQPLVAIIGRPNVGKSTLFNRLTGSRKAIVGDEPGITRDRMFGEVEWRGQLFRLVDTGGIVPDDEAIIPSNIFKQASHAIDESQAIIWVLDSRASSVPVGLPPSCRLKWKEASNGDTAVASHRDQPSISQSIPGAPK